MMNSRVAVTAWHPARIIRRSSFCILHSVFCIPSVFVLVVALAAVLRLKSLDNRPMHCDEANQAVKFGRLLESGHYRYDPWEHHGPSLNYLTLPVARLAGAKKLTGVTEAQLRLVPAIFGIGLVGLLWLLRDELGRPAVLGAGVLTAVSPAMVFYGRYYIAEMLLVGFTFAAMIALVRWGREIAVCSTADGPVGRRPWPRWGLWLVLLGLSAGMMHATKESCVIPLFAMAVAGVLTTGDLRRMRGRRFLSVLVALLTGGLRRVGGRRLAVSGLVVLLVAAGTSALFFSSFFDHPRGVADSVLTYGHYFRRAAGEGTAGPHVYPWYHYFRVLFWWQKGGGPVWSEAAIAALALVGLVAGTRGEGRGARSEGKDLHQTRPDPSPLTPSPSPLIPNLPIVRFLGIYTVLMTVVYSALTYKTPWCALGLLHGMILLAGVGMAVLVRAAPGRLLKAAAIALLIAASGHLAWQAHRASFVAYEDPSNPYVYAHTTSDVPRLTQRIEEISAVHPRGRAMHVQVICPDDDHWPLPWYLRGFTRVGWFRGVPQGPAAPLIITRPEMEPALVDYLMVKPPPGERHLYVRLPADDQDADEKNNDWQLRPNVPLRVYVRLDLWEAYRNEGRGATR